VRLPAEQIRIGFLAVVWVVEQVSDHSSFFQTKSGANMRVNVSVVKLPMRRMQRAMDSAGPMPVQNFGTVALQFDASQSSMWITMQSQERRPLNFSRELLDAFEQAFTTYESNGGEWQEDGLEAQPIHYAILRSGHPNYFNIGGDLGYFQSCIELRDFSALRAYSMRCLDLTCRWFGAVTQRTTTIALVQGRALGGGFETALASDYVIAEEQAEFGLPEVLFGLFPCTGAMSLLTRRIGLSAAENMMRGGRVYSAAALLELGVIDHVCPTGEGERFTRDFVASHAKVRPARHALQRAKRRMMPLDREEMTAVVEDWVDVARQLKPENLRVLDTLIRMQASEFVRESCSMHDAG
jgi:DSF synthase